MAENPFDFFIAEVRDHDGDPWKSGRVKLRVYGRHDNEQDIKDCLLYTSPSPRDRTRSRMPSSA